MEVLHYNRNHNPEVFKVIFSVLKCTLDTIDFS